MTKIPLGPSRWVCDFRLDSCLILKWLKPLMIWGRSAICPSEHGKQQGNTGHCLFKSFLNLTVRIVSETFFSFSSENDYILILSIYNSFIYSIHPFSWFITFHLPIWQKELSFPIQFRPNDWSLSLPRLIYRGKQTIVHLLRAIDWMYLHGCQEHHTSLNNAGWVERGVRGLTADNGSQVSH